jgi:hypothetical protein
MASLERFGWGFQILPYLGEGSSYDTAESHRGMEEAPVWQNAWFALLG